MLLFLIVLLFWLVFCITSCHNTWVVRGNPKPDRPWTDQRHLIDTMKHNVQTASHRDYGEDNTETKPRLELAPFLGQRRLFAANFRKWRMVYDPYTGRYHRNGEFVNVYDLVTGLPMAVRAKGTNADHMWIEGADWPNDEWRITDIPKMQKVSFTGMVTEYTTPEKKYIDYCAKQVTDVLDWDRYDRDQEILADIAAGCPDVPHFTPGEYSTFIPSLGNGQNPNGNGNDEIPMNH